MSGPIPSPTEWRRLAAGSVTRRMDLAEPYDVVPVERREWRENDLAVAEVTRRPAPDRRLEGRDGRMADLAVGDHVIGVLGTRHATLEAVGSWRDVGDDGAMHLMTSAGLLGRVTSVSPLMGPPVEAQYVGHLRRGDATLHLDESVPDVVPTPLTAPTLLLIGTSMSSGKTTAAKVLVRLLKQRGLRVVGSKLTGAGRYRDILAMRDAGADAIFDFVDVGLSSTVVDTDLCRTRLQTLFSLIALEQPDVLVAEAGASPLEPYNGETAMEVLGDRVACTVLCASDPYAVAGVVQGFGRRADLVTGIAATTSAGVELITRLTGLPACNVLDPEATPMLEDVLDRCLPS